MIITHRVLIFGLGLPVFLQKHANRQVFAAYYFNLLGLDFEQIFLVDWLAVIALVNFRLYALLRLELP